VALNPWMFEKFETVNWYNGPFDLEIILTKRDVRGGFDLGRTKKERFLIENIDFTRKDKEYWKEVFMKIWNSGQQWNVKIPHEQAAKLINSIRELRYCHRRPKFKAWAERYSKRIADWAIYIIEREIDDPCKDNYRLARVGDKKALRYYAKQQESGCCGQFDIVCRCPCDLLRKYHIGCNYGH